jgi:subtilisin family serine protease
MRDDHKVIHSMIIHYSSMRLRQIFSIILILFLLFTTFPSSIGKIESDDTYSYIIEFTSPGLIKKIYSESLDSNIESNLDNHRFLDLLNNISNYHQSALDKIKNRINFDISSNKIDHYKLLFNGIKIENISDTIAKEIASLPFVKKIEKDNKIFKTDISNPSTNELTFSNTNSLGSLKNITNYSGKNVSIAFFDTGIDYNHPALSSCYSGGYDFTNQDNDPYDDNGHGTHVIGITAAQSMINSNITMKGIAPDASIYVYKVLDEEGNGYTSWFLSAFELALDPNQDGNFSDHVDIISISAGNPNGSESDLLSSAATQAVKAGITVVAAAGNNGPEMNTIHSPAIASEVIAVGASLSTYGVTSYSSRGGLNYSSIKPDIIAPGHHILSTWPNNQYKTLSGTSMATPYITGIIACLLEYNPKLSPTEIQYMLHSNAKSLGNNISEEGYGLINYDSFQIKESIPSFFSATQQKESNNLLINISIQEPISSISYSIHIQAINQVNTIDYSINNQQNHLTDINLNIALGKIITGYYTITITLMNNNTITCLKKIIYLKNETKSFNYIPEIVQTGESFVCYYQENNSKLPLVFLFVVPLRSIQLRIGSNPTFTAPTFPFLKPRNISAMIYIISFDLPVNIQKYKIIINNSDSYQSESTSSPPENNN